MRQDIIVKETNGSVTLSLKKAIGKGYGHFWFTNNHCRYRFLKGSRNSKKSVTCSYEIVIKIMSDRRRNILICRQNYVDIRDSIFKSILRAFNDLGFQEGQDYTYTMQPLEITIVATGQKILFRGLNNPTSITSIVPQFGYLTDCYIEEFYEVQNPEDFSVLDGSFRGKLPEGLFFQITCMFNAWSKEHWSYAEFFKGNLEDDEEILEKDGKQEFIDENYVYGFGRGLYLMTVNYLQNEFRDIEIYDIAMSEMKNKDIERYRVEGLGMWGVATAACYPAFNDSLCKPIQELLQEQYMYYAIGIDTGLTQSDGHKHAVLKNQDPLQRVRSATTMTLGAVTQGYQKIVILDEYYHTNIQQSFDYNTDKAIHPGAMTQPELASYLIIVIKQWIDKYANYVGKPRHSSLMNGMIDVYVDGADIGFRQTLEFEARKAGMYNVRFMGSGQKMSIQSRVDLENHMQHYGNFLVCKENCPNTMREFKNARRGEKGEARADTDDHVLTSCEYLLQPIWNEIIQRHNFKMQG